VNGGRPWAWEDGGVTARTWGWLAAVVDVLLIVVFALVGRSSHGEADSALGLATTAWPFLVGWAVGYVVTRAWARPLRLWPTGVVVWLLTVAGGMALRVASGQGDVAGDPLPVSFVVVATIVLGVFLLGWRGIALLVLRGRARRGAARQR
jgi:peptidoglycan/LPS O-acetylase OafA/YrhL